MLSFNHLGYLSPANKISSSLQEVKNTLATSDIRTFLFEKYLAYAGNLKSACGQEYTQWMNGSFCTLKPKPGDIDLVSFVPAAIINTNEQLFKQFCYPNSEIDYGVDAYIVKVYAENERNYNHYVADRLYWMEYFGRTKLTRTGKRYAKGFVEIIF